MQNLGFTLFFLWIAVGNLAVGFALAVAMGHGPRRMPHVKLAVSSKMKLPSIPKWQLPALRLGNKAAQQAPPNAPPANVEVAAQPLVEPSRASIDEGLSLDEALAQFQMDVLSVRGGAEAIDERVRACSAAPTVEIIEECVADLKDAGSRFLDQQAGVAQTLENSSATAGSGAPPLEELQDAANAQASQIQQTLNEIDTWEIDPANLERDCQRLLEETGAIVSSCQELDARLDYAQSQMAKGNNASSTTSDDTARLSGGDAPAHLEQMNASAALDDWWADDPHHQRPLTMGMIDVDGVERLNDELGRERVDELLAQIEALILAADIEGGNASQIDPQRFLLLLPNLSHDRCTRCVESIREAIENIDPFDEQNGHRVTASCAVAIATTGDTARALVSRAEAALVEAKQFGGNRTFLNEGEFPTPVARAEAAVPAGIG